MSDRTNDEKLRILQERLAQIKEKHNRKAKIEAEIEIATPEVETPAKNKKPLYSSRYTLFIIIGVVACGLFVVFNNNEKIIEETIPFKLTYSFELEEGGVLAIIGSFEKEGPAKALANNLTVQGFKCNYFFLPDKSNSKEEIYKVFIGPYENEEETNQWTENLELDFEIIKL